MIKIVVVAHRRRADHKRVSWQVHLSHDQRPYFGHSKKNPQASPPVDPLAPSLPNPPVPVHSTSKFDIGVFRNFQEVFGKNPLLWLVPGTGPCGNGLRFEPHPNLAVLGLAHPADREAYDVSYHYTVGRDGRAVRVASPSPNSPSGGPGGGAGGGSPHSPVQGRVVRGAVAGEGENNQNVEGGHRSPGPENPTDLLFY